jgi:hypothetical protein
MRIRSHIEIAVNNLARIERLANPDHRSFRQHRGGADGEPAINLFAVLPPQHQQAGRTQGFPNGFGHALAYPVEIGGSRLIDVKERKNGDGVGGAAGSGNRQ